MKALGFVAENLNFFYAIASKQITHRCLPTNTFVSTDVCAMVWMCVCEWVSVLVSGPKIKTVLPKRILIFLLSFCQRSQSSSVFYFQCARMANRNLSHNNNSVLCRALTIFIHTRKTATVLSKSTSIRRIRNAILVGGDGDVVVAVRIRLFIVYSIKQSAIKQQNQKIDDVPLI